MKYPWREPGAVFSKAGHKENATIGRQRYPVKVGDWQGLIQEKLLFTDTFAKRPPWALGPPGNIQCDYGSFSYNTDFDYDFCPIQCYSVGIEAMGYIPNQMVFISSINL